MESETPSWIVGIELSPRSSGALQFARWLRETLHARVLGVYVSEMYMLGLPPSDGAAFVLAMRSEAEHWLGSLGAGAPGAAIDATQILDEVDAEAGLVKAARGAAGLIIGRRVGKHRYIRLGRVARRLLRSLPAPVIVVPPELDAGGFAGPVLLATDLHEQSIPAARFAASFAAAAGRGLVCVHIGQPRWDSVSPEAEPRWAELRRIYRENTEREAHAWAARVCPGAEVMLEYGDPAERLAAVAELRRASLLVLGSQRLGLVGRIFIGSAASTVAATAGCAVAVVPPDVTSA